MASPGALAAAAIVVACALAACSDSSATNAVKRSTGNRPVPPTAGIAPTTLVPSTVATLPTTTAPAAFVGTVSAVTAADLPYSYRPGCPVGPEDLRMLHMSYWGFDAQPHIGAMVVNAAVTDDVLTVFATLYAERFPIRQMLTIDAFQGSDPASEAADNTSGFNCRYAVAPGPAQWSAHAYGEAIDVNTVENPYIYGGSAQPDAGTEYVDRSVYRPGMAVAGGQLVAAFASVGWQWGGDWAGSPDYQHFSKTGA